MTLKRYLPWFTLRPTFFALLLLIFLSSSSYAQAEAKNIILFIGDGMGPAHVLAARVFAQGPEGRLNMETLEHSGYVSTHSSSFITDSAASGTALATGNKTKNGVIGESPGGKEYKTILEIARQMGKAAGLVTTTEVTHATPAAFAAHESHRSNAMAIARDYLYGSQPEVILGGGSEPWPPELQEEARQKGYAIIYTKGELERLNSQGVNKVLGLFARGHLGFVGERGPEEPSLRDMTLKALGVLQRDTEGFFLMVEGGRIDHAGHQRDIKKVVYELIEFDETIGAVLQWLKARLAQETLILVTADHETGGLALTGPSDRLPQRGEIIEVRWSTSQHTALDVPLWAQGPGAERVHGRMDNTEVFEIMRDALSSP